MKVLIVSESDGSGGAGIAANRLYNSLSKASHSEVKMYVNRKFTNSKNVLGSHSLIYRISCSLIRRLENQVARILSQKDDYHLSVGFFSVEYFSRGLFKFIKDYNPDIINIHWVHGGFLGYLDLKYLLKHRCIITLHDEWFIQGMEHYFNSDIKPSKFRIAVSKFLKNKKRELYHRHGTHFIVLNDWMKSKAIEFGIHEDFIHKSYNCLDTNVFSYKGKPPARADSKFVLLLGAQAVDKDRRKGFDLFVNSLKFLSEVEKSSLNVYLFGASEKSEINFEGVTIISTGSISNEQELSNIYRSADIFLLPSRSDNLPNTVLEALCCGCYVVAFNVGGLSEILKESNSGYLAEPANCKDLAKGVSVGISRGRRNISKRGESAIITFNEKVISNRYFSIFRDI